MAAEKVTPEAINFMAKFGRGLICLTLTRGNRSTELNLPLMSPINTAAHGTAIHRINDARHGTTTGISAPIATASPFWLAIDPLTRPSDLSRVPDTSSSSQQPSAAAVLVRAGQTAASVDLARIAGMTSAGVICEIMNDDGTMSRVPQLIEFCRTHGLKMLTVAELIRYRMQHRALRSPRSRSSAGHGLRGFSNGGLFQ